jgi:multiple sugar transport system ATP-binding protein
MAQVTLQNVTKNFGSVQIIKGVDLNVADGEFCVFVGPSGCGKSTLLRMIAGLEDITSGTLQIGGKEMAQVASADRGVAMVFQSYALYPHMTVKENISFGMRMAKMPAEQIAARVKVATDMLQLDKLMDRKPSMLSGGQRQRVAIGRAIVREPEVFLFDEPLSNLDASLRVQMRIEITKLHQDLKSTMIYVTHDQVEAMTMADKIVVLSAGLIEQVGSPLELYHRPNNMFVAGFIGSPKMNFIKATVSPMKGGKVVVSMPGNSKITLDGQGKTVTEGQAVTLGIRPEHITIGEKNEAELKGHLRIAEYLGSETMFYASLADGTDLSVKADGLTKAKTGTEIKFGVPAAACHLFDASGKTILNGDLSK